MISKQGSDLSDLINDAAGDYADAFTGVLIAESGLNEHALREGVWPDYSAGLSQVIAANLGFGTLKQRPHEEDLEVYRAFMFWPENAITEGWTHYRAALKRMAGDPLWSALSYNRGPSFTRAQLEEQVRTLPAIRSRFEHYQRSLQAAERYRMAVDDGVRASEPMRQKLAAVGDYAIAASDFLEVGVGLDRAERVQGTKGYYLSSPVDGWVLHGPFSPLGDAE